MGKYDVIHVSALSLKSELDSNSTNTRDYKKN